MNRLDSIVIRNHVIPMNSGVQQALLKRKREDDAGLEPDEIVTIKNTMGSKGGKSLEPAEIIPFFMTKLRIKLGHFIRTVFGEILSMFKSCPIP